jgi:hypothetical protein
MEGDVSKDQEPIGKISTARKTNNPIDIRVKCL